MQSQDIRKDLHLHSINDPEFQINYGFILRATCHCLCLQKIKTTKPSKWNIMYKIRKVNTMHQMIIHCLYILLLFNNYRIPLAEPLTVICWQWCPSYIMVMQCIGRCNMSIRKKNEACWCHENFAKDELWLKQIKNSLTKEVMTWTVIHLMTKDTEIWMSIMTVDEQLTRQKSLL